MAAELALEYQAVRTFLRRNKSFADSLGVKFQAHINKEDYETAITTLTQRKAKLTHQNIALELGRDRGTVTRYFGRHAELHTAPLVPRARPVPQELPEPTACETAQASEVAEVEAAVPPASAPLRWRTDKELFVSCWDERCGRLVSKSASLVEYIQLWDKGLLKFQQEGAPQPDHLPSREQARKLIYAKTKP
jgi:hypothetical protein